MSLPTRVNRFTLLTLTTAVALSATLWSRGSHAAQGPAASSEAASSPQFFTDHVQPVFANNCYRCHSGMNHRGGLRLDSPEEILKGGKEGPVVVPGHPEESLLIKLIRHEGPPDDPKPMPPRSKLSDADIAAVTAWIQGGAKMPDVSAAATSASK